MYKIDLHTHSIASPDGALTAEDYRRLLASGALDVIAVTDHETVTFALALQRELGDKIIVGEEIKTTEGEIIGLFLKKRIPPGLTPEETVRQIRAQNGLVYIPHPFETLRQGMQEAALNGIASEVDVLETCNGRAYFQNNSEPAKRWAKTHGVVGAASSDAHGKIGWGKTYSVVDGKPTRNNLASLLGAAVYSTEKVGFRGSLYPKFNRLRKRFSNHE